MTAIILAFPADRCRQPLSVIEAAEREVFERAAKLHEAEAGQGESIVAIMALAMEGTCTVTRAKAAAWLHVQCDIRVA